MRRSARLLLSTVVAITTVASYAAASAAHATDANGATRAVDQVLVKFQPGTAASDIAAAVAGAGATDVGTVRDLGVHVLRVPSAAVDQVVAALSHRSDVSYAEPDSLTQATLTPNDPDWAAQWGPAKINAATAWDSTTGASSVVIATLDTGVEYAHPDLQGRFVAGYDFVNNDSDPSDDNGHGTSVAGVVGATANNSTGLAGMCWQCMMMPVKVLDANGTGSYSALANGITWATDHGASVISMSLAGTSDSSTLHNAVQYAHNHGVVLVSAAGNSGSSAMVYPAAYAEVIGVAGTTTSDTLYSWSDYGSWVKVAAPGCNDATVIGSSYGSFCGTSSATPIVAGLVGLARSLQPSATNTQIESAVESSAVKIGSVVAYGRVDAAATLSALTAAGSTPPPPASNGTTTTTFSGSLTGKNTSKSYSLTSGTGTLAASLSFTKATSMSLQLVNSTGQVVASASGASPVTLSASVTAGGYTLTVTGPSRANFTLTVTSPTP